MVAAALAAGGYASHRTAAALWRLPGLDEGVVEITTERRPRATNIVCHRRKLQPCDVTKIDQIPVTGIHRTLIDLGDVVDRLLVEDAVDDAMSRKLTSGDWLQRELARIGVNGRKGARILADVLDEGNEHPPSWLERRFIRMLGRATLPSYVREFRALEYRIDFAWPEVCLGVEVHGEKWHKKRLRWSADLERHNQLTAAGWTILHFTWSQIRKDPFGVVAEIVSTYVGLTRRLDDGTR